MESWLNAISEDARDREMISPITTDNQTRDSKQANASGRKWDDHSFDLKRTFMAKSSFGSENALTIVNRTALLPINLIGTLFYHRCPNFTELMNQYSKIHLQWQTQLMDWGNQMNSSVSENINKDSDEFCINYVISTLLVASESFTTIYISFTCK
jgi:hypothetical protein